MGRGGGLIAACAARSLIACSQYCINIATNMIHIVSQFNHQQCLLGAVVDEFEGILYT